MIALMLGAGLAVPVTLIEACAAEGTDSEFAWATAAWLAAATFIAALAQLAGA